MSGRDFDPGDAVPPGVAPLEPVPLTGQDEAVKRKLERLGDGEREDPTEGKTQEDPKRRGD